MRKVIALWIIVLFSVKGHAQKEPGAYAVLQKLDSFRNCASPSRHFAGIYFETTDAAMQFFSKENDRVKQLMDRLETRFASYFFCSAEAFQNNEDVGLEWKFYYADSSVSQVKCILFGINAHINGDIWQALTAEFSLEDIMELKPYYISFNKGLQRMYSDVYRFLQMSSPKLKMLHEITLGTDKLYGRMLLKRWRKRQIKLAELFYTDKKKFDKKLEKIRHKAEHVNKLVNWYM